GRLRSAAKRAYVSGCQVSFSGAKGPPSVADALEEEPRRRRGPLRGSARLLAEESLDPGGIDVPAADLHERAGEAAHHLPEEVRRGHADVDLVARLRDLALLDDDDRRLLALGVLAEGREVVAALEEPGRPAHRRGVEAVADPPDVRLAECGAPS